MNRYCVLCAREYGPEMKECCTHNSFVGIERVGFFRKQVRYFTLGGNCLSEIGLAAIREGAIATRDSRDREAVTQSERVAAGALKATAAKSSADAGFGSVASGLTSGEVPVLLTRLTAAIKKNGQFPLIEVSMREERSHRLIAWCYAEQYGIGLDHKAAEIYLCEALVPYGLRASAIEHEGGYDKAGRVRRTWVFDLLQNSEGPDPKLSKDADSSAAAQVENPSRGQASDAVRPPAKPAAVPGPAEIPQIKCPDCGTSMPYTAAACPKCGRRMVTLSVASGTVHMAASEERTYQGRLVNHGQPTCSKCYKELVKTSSGRGGQVVVLGRSSLEEHFDDYTHFAGSVCFLDRKVYCHICLGNQVDRCPDCGRPVQSAYRKVLKELWEVQWRAGFR